MKIQHKMNNKPKLTILDYKIILLIIQTLIKKKIQILKLLLQTNKTQIKLAKIIIIRLFLLNCK